MPATVTKGHNRFQIRFVGSVRRNMIVLLGVAFLAVTCIVAALAPFLVTHDYAKVDLLNRLRGPTVEHILGTDQFGRDIYSRLVMGARVSLLVGVIATFSACVLGVSIGALSGWVGGWLDDILMRTMDIVLAFPAIILAVALAAVFGPGLDKVILIVGLTRVPQFARVARAAVLSNRGLEYVVSASSLGRRSGSVLVRHVLPNSLAPILVYASVSIATAINMEAALSFLGLGIQSPAASWGTMLSDAKQYMLLSPWLAIFPGLAITLTVLSFNLLGDGLRDLTDPRLRGRR